MTLPWIADAHTCVDETHVQAVITAHTCPLDGYIYAWVDSDNPLLVWSVAVCPADSVTPTMTQIIANAVNVRYNNTDTTTDPHVRAQQIIAEVKSDVGTWLYAHTTADIANYLSQDAKVQTAILAAMATAGAINQITN